LDKERDNGGKNGGKEEDLDRSSWTGGWWRTDTGNSKKRHNNGRSGANGHLHLPD